MAGSVATSQRSNGLEGPSVAFQEELEYEKILSLRDAIVAGTHPRLKLASKAARVVTPQKISPPPKPVSKLVNGASSTPTPAPIREPTYNNPTTSSIPVLNVLSTTASDARQKPPPKITTSGLDPIFLEKGENLIREEMRLERQRIERTLENQVQQRRLTTRQRISDQDSLPDFDVTEVLFQAQELVKPIAAAESHGANGIASSSDSFDDVTFYSSQMNESTTDEADDHPKRRMTKPCKYFFEGTCKKGDSCTFSHDPAFKQKLQGDAPLTMELDSQNVSREPVPEAARRQYAEQQASKQVRRYSIDIDRGFESDPQVPGPAPVQGTASLRDRPYHHSRDSGEIFEEPSHVPEQIQRPRSSNRPRNARPGDFPMERDYSYQDSNSPNGRFQPGSVSKRNGRVSPASRDGRIVRNHITSPIAPQPARVSPLAVAKVPRLDQIRRNEHEPYSPRSPRRPGTAGQSPFIASQPANSRKRRREPDLAEATRNVTARRDLDSPMPYIKDEPISPPPFSEYPARQPSRYEQVGQAGRQPLVIESTPPHLQERVIYERRHPEPPYVRVSDLQHVSTPAVRRVFSRAGHHYEVQEEPEVRQVYSARQQRRVLSPQQDLEHYSAPQARPPRAASRAYVVQPNKESQQPYRASVQPQAVAYSRVGPPRDRSLSPDFRPLPYSPPQREFAPMAPPVRRVVMDQYGQKYYEAPIAENPRASVVPSQRYVTEPAIPIERSAPRRASVHPQLPKAYDGGPYIRAIQSPAPTSPSYVEYYPAVEPASMVSRQRVYEPREEPYQDRDEVVRVIEYPQERTVQRYEEAPMPREGMTRMHSVRPSGGQYEISREHIPRVQTAQPERIFELGGRRDARPLRQVSLRTDDGYERGPAYVAAERPRYQYVPETRDAGYTGGPMQGEVVMEGPRSAGRRPLQRL